MTGEQLYERERTGADRPWDELLPSIQDGWNQLAQTITDWTEVLDAQAAE